MMYIFCRTLLNAKANISLQLPVCIPGGLFSQFETRYWKFSTRDSELGLLKGRESGLESQRSRLEGLSTYF